jgi:hypothetical protein
MAFYYDNDTQHIASVGELKPVERVYAIQFSEFTEAHTKHLDQVYRSLPEFRGYGTDGTPSWFGSEALPPFLWASVEPSGLLVHGLLSSAQWVAWDTHFREHLHEFPIFEV